MGQEEAAPTPYYPEPRHTSVEFSLQGSVITPCYKVETGSKVCGLPEAAPAFSCRPCLPGQRLITLHVASPYTLL